MDELPANWELWATKFKHEPLPDPTTYIRLLEIECIHSNGVLGCVLTTWPVAKVPEYYAISYVIPKYIGYALQT